MNFSGVLKPTKLDLPALKIPGSPTKALLHFPNVTGPDGSNYDDAKDKNH